MRGKILFVVAVLVAGLLAHQVGNDFYARWIEHTGLELPGTTAER